MTEFSDAMRLDAPFRKKVLIEGREVVVRLEPLDSGSLKLVARSKDGLRLSGIYAQATGDEEKKIGEADFRHSVAVEKTLNLSDLGLSKEAVASGSYNASIFIQACKAGCYRIIFKTAAPA